MSSSVEARHVKNGAPTHALRITGFAGVAFGLLLIVAFVVGVTAFTPTNEGDPAATSTATHGVLFLAMLVILGVIELSVGVVALVASAKPPLAERLSRVVDFLGFTAGVLTFGGAVALTVLASGLYAAVLIALVAGVLATTLRAARIFAAVKKQGAVHPS